MPTEVPIDVTLFHSVAMFCNLAKFKLISLPAESPLFRTENMRMYTCLASGHDAVLLSWGAELFVVVEEQ
jgi:hypothetical protein